MPVQDWLWSGICWALAFIWFIYWLLHRNSEPDSLEVSIIPSKYLSNIEVNGESTKNPFYSLTPGRSFSAIFGLSITNHNQQQKVHLDSVHIVLRGKKWPWGRRELVSTPVKVLKHPNDYILQNVDIEPQQKKEYPINVWKSIPIISPFPRKSRLILILEFIGGTRRIEHTLMKFRHDPKQVPDIPDWKRQ